MSPNLYPGVFKGDMGDKGGFDTKLWLPTSYSN
jgi:hypothetical protein